MEIEKHADRQYHPLYNPIAESIVRSLETNFIYLTFGYERFYDSTNPKSLNTFRLLKEQGTGKSQRNEESEIGKWISLCDFFFGG